MKNKAADVETALHGRTLEWISQRTDGDASSMPHRQVCRLAVGRWEVQRIQIVKAIDSGQSFQLPDNSLSSTVMATGIKLDDGRYSTFTVTGIEITADGLIVTADELIYHRDTHQIELRGNVQLKPVSPQ